MRLYPDLRRRLSVLLPVAVVAAVALSAITELAYQRSTAALGSLASRGAARTAIMTVLRRLLDAESSQRGYLITGRKEYLQPGEEAPEDIRRAVEELERHYAADPTQLALTAELKARALEKLSELSATLRLYEEGNQDRWRDLVLTNIGREKMDAVRSTAERLLAAEDASVLVERASVLDVLANNRAGVYLLTVLSVLALYFYLRKTVALEVAQRRHAEDLQAERDELEVQVQHRTTELTELASHLQSAREDERSRLARELHDELGALLTAAKLDVARLKRGIGTMTADLEQRIKHLNSTIDQGIALKRNIIEDLRPSSLSNLGLVAALEIQGREFAARSGLPVTMDLAPVALPEPLQITVYRVVQESLTNIAKYARATEVTVSLQPEGARVSVAVSDNGCGFDPAVRGRSSHGLTGMRYRVEAGGGELRVISAPGRGTRVQAWLPAVPAPAAATAPATPDVA
jgi:signal transduction histidine kinase